MMRDIVRLLLSRPFWTRGKMIAAGLAAAALVAFLFYPRADAVQFTTELVIRGDLTVTVSATGNIQPGNQVDVGTEVSGRVDDVFADFNDRVKAGQLLALINTDTPRAQLAQHRAALEQGRAALATSEATVEQTLAKRDRYRRLQASGALALQELQTAQADYTRAVASVAEARAKIAAAQAQMANSQTSISKAEVRSPIDGVVLDRKVSKGQTVAASFNTPVLFTLASDLSVMQLSVDIDEADIASVREGQTADFTVEAFDNRHFSARLVALHNSPKIDNGVVSYPGVLLVDNRAGLLRPGLTATVEILVAKRRNALIVPSAALRYAPPSTVVANAPRIPAAADGKTAGRVWVLAAGRLEPRDVLVGNSDGRVTEILSGNLKPGERVITDIAKRPPS